MNKYHFFEKFYFDVYCPIFERIGIKPVSLEEIYRRFKFKQAKNKKWIRNK